MSFRVVHLFDPQLAGVGGHYLNHDEQLVRDLLRRGLRVEIYGRKDAHVQVEQQPVHPTFTLDIFKEAATDPAVWAMENFHAINEAFLADLRALPAERFSSEDLIYLPNLLQNQLHAVARWLEELPSDRRPAVAVMLRYLNHAMDYVQKRQNKELILLQYRFAARALKAVQPRFQLCADTRELAQAYQQITSLPVLELPNPMDVATLLTTPATERPPGGRPVVLYQGHTSALRGFQFLPEMIARAQKLSPRPRFIVQVQNRESAAACGLTPVLTLLDRQAAAGHVELVEGPLESARYYGLLREADVVVLPYSPTFYGHGSSGVFTEAASLGKVIVVSPKTVPARQGQEFGLGVVTAAQWTPAAMADALGSALAQLPTLRAQAEAGAPRFRADQCAAVLWDRLLGAFTTAEPTAAAA